MKTSIVQWQTVVNFTLARAIIFYNLGESPKPHSRQPAQNMWDDLDKSVFHKRQKGDEKRNGGENSMVGAVSSISAI